MLSSSRAFGGGGRPAFQECDHAPLRVAIDINSPNSDGLEWLLEGSDDVMVYGLMSWQFGALADLQPRPPSHATISGSPHMPLVAGSDSIVLMRRWPFEEVDSGTPEVQVQWSRSFVPYVPMVLGVEPRVSLATNCHWQVWQQIVIAKSGNRNE